MVVELTVEEKRTPSQWAYEEPRKERKGGKEKKEKKCISTRTELNHSEGPSTPHKLQRYAVISSAAEKKA
jgi:hypothetical protein